jgi:hypothetical protein
MVAMINISKQCATIWKKIKNFTKTIKWMEKMITSKVTYLIIGIINIFKVCIQKINCFLNSIFLFNFYSFHVLFSSITELTLQILMENMIKK